MNQRFFSIKYIETTFAVEVFDGQVFEDVWASLGGMRPPERIGTVCFLTHGAAVLAGRAKLQKKREALLKKIAKIEEALAGDIT